MRQGQTAESGVLGFLTVAEYPEHGLFGGYLLLNRAGRPLEFHCTAPIRATRAQEILYGPSLGPFLYGEQIGATLVRHAKTTPLIVLTDREPALALREHIDLPVALVLVENPAEATGADDSDARAQLLRLDAAHTRGGASRPHRSASGDLVSFEFGSQRLAVARDCEADQSAVAEGLVGLSGAFDLSEPFGRIQEAIAEARRGSR